MPTLATLFRRSLRAGTNLRRKKKARAVNALFIGGPWDGQYNAVPNGSETVTVTVDGVGTPQVTEYEKHELGGQFFFSPKSIPLQVLTRKLFTAYRRDPR